MDCSDQLSIAKKELLPNLRKVVDILNKNKIHFWMYGGALLGYIRDGDLIPWAKDIDLFVWKDDYPTVVNLKKEFKKVGIKMMIKEKKLRLWWGKRNRYEIDLLYYTLKGDYAVMDRLNPNRLSPIKLKLGNMIYFTIFIKSVQYNMKTTYHLIKWLLLKLDLCYIAKQVVPSHFFLNLKDIDFFGIKLKVPAETEAYLEYTFGSDWRIPKKDFNYNPEYFMRIDRSTKK